jgi:CO dehydrogenase/acetyl-CoA synthase delta subunit
MSQDTSHDSRGASENPNDHEEPLPEEPRTPLWVTILGVVLLVSGVLIFLVIHEPTVETEKQRVEVTSEGVGKDLVLPETPPEGVQPEEGAPVRRIPALRQPPPTTVE